MSERKRIERRLQEKNDELGNALLARDRFLASMSHELRTPLNAIIGFTGVLLMRLPGPLTADQEHHLRTSQTSARHLLSLINDLLDLAKIESGKLELNLELVEAQSILVEVAASLRPLAEGKGLQFELLMPKRPVKIITDRRALSQILLNLAGNAIKFTERGQVTVRIQRNRRNGHLLTRMSVVDTGPGIDVQDQARLFKPFSQLQHGNDEQDGTGLGLHLSQQLAQLIGGTVECESVPGRGSRFTLSLQAS
jgi:protein-histidine pros-kinase